MEKVLNSSVIESLLPDFVRSDHPTFTLFIKKYYEWLETNGQVNDQMQQLAYTQDADLSNDFFFEKFTHELAPYFPKEVVSNKRLFLKLVSHFYRANGTPDSIKFLFRALFNDNIELYYPKEDILKASDGKWVLPLALRIETADDRILNIEKTILTGKTSKATAVVEKVVRSIDRQLGVSYIEVYISNIKRLFKTGETVTATYNDGVENITVSGKLVGALSDIKIDSKNRGLYYNGYDVDTGYPGDPIVILGGLNPDATNPIGASANVGETTKGSITDIIVSEGGFGFRKQFDDPNTIIFDFRGGFENAPFGTEAAAQLSLVDENTVRVLNVSSLSVSTLDSIKSNIAVFENTSIQNISTYQSFNVYPMSFVTLEGSGGGYRNKPRVDTYSLYNEIFDDSLIVESVSLNKDTNTITVPDGEDDLTLSLEPSDVIRLYKKNPNFEDLYEVTAVTANTLTLNAVIANDIEAVSIYKVNRNDLYKLGSLGRIGITEGGEDYALNDIVIFTGGSGYGANAYVSELHAGNNGIKAVTINNHSSNSYLLGGEGYTRDQLPTLSVQSANGSNAIIYVKEVCGDGETLDLTTSRIGAISSIRITSYGYDYISAPIVSLRVVDLKVVGATVGQLFVANTTVYQGSSNSTNTFKATVDRYDATTGFLRVFNYSGTIEKDTLIKYDNDVTTNAVSATVQSFTVYGDGRAKATATFENGLIRYPGIYLNTDGQVSADKKLQDSNKYHNFSYIIKTKTDYNKFKKPLQDISHPVGTKTFVQRIVDNVETITPSNNQYILTVQGYNDTFNVSNGSANIISTNVSANLQATINVGDTIVLQNISEQLKNTGVAYRVNVVSGSNIVFGGANVNFINDLQDGDTIYLSTGNTVTVKSVTNATHLIVGTTINVSNTNATINRVYDEVVKVGWVNNKMMISNTIIRGTDTHVPMKIIKSR